MATPISNNTSTLINNNQAARPGEREKGGQATGQPDVESATGMPRDDAVILSRAAELLNQSQTERGQGKIESPDQAAELAQQLKAQIEANPNQAMMGQSTSISKDLMELLKAG